MITSTNAIRDFANKVRAVNGTSGTLHLSAQEARNLNHEIQQLMARLIELQELAEVGKVKVEVTAPKF